MAGPYVELPADDAALETLLRGRQLGPPAPWEATPWDFVRRWPHEILRDRAWPIISRLMTNADHVVRARAVEFARLWSEGAALTMPRLLEVAEHHADLFGDQKEASVTLRTELAHALCDLLDPSNGARIATALREMAKHEPIGGGAAGVLGRCEPMFVAAQAQQWGDAQVDWIVAAASSMATFRRDAVIPFLQALRGLGHPTRERILAAVEQYIERDDGRASSLARVRGLPPPSKSAPSTEDCRIAIGL